MGRNNISKALLVICVVYLSMAGSIHAERYSPDKAEKYPITIQDKRMYFYRYKSKDYLHVTVDGLSGLNLSFFKRNPDICFEAKIAFVHENAIEVYNSSNKLYFAASLRDDVEKFKRGDNVWGFGKVVLFENDDYEIRLENIFNLRSDEEIFLSWKEKIPENDPEALLELGLKAIRYGQEKGNREIWEKLGRDTILDALKIKKGEIQEVGDYISLSEEVMKLLNDRDLAAKIVIEGWKNNKNNPELTQYIRRRLKYSLYKGTWYPLKDRYEKEFNERFNSIKYTEDDKMWELKEWVERNADKIENPQEKIIQCAQKTYEMNPSRKDAAIFLGKQPENIGGLTSGDEVTVLRQPVDITSGKLELEFGLDNFWSLDSEIPESIAVRYSAGKEQNTEVSVKYIEWGSNIEEVKNKYMEHIDELAQEGSLRTEVITVEAEEVYRIVFTFEKDAQLFEQETLIVFNPGDAPSLALQLITPQNTSATYAEEFSKIRESIKITYEE